MPEVVTLIPTWRALPGFGYGLAQPLLLGQMHLPSQLTPPASAGMATLDRCLAAAIDAAPPETAPSETPGAVIERLLHWTGALQRHARIAMAEGGRAWPRSRPDATAHTRFGFALPTRHARVTMALMGDLVAWANRLLDPAAPAGAAAGVAADIEATLRRLREHAEPGFNQFHVLRAAQRLALPVFALDERRWRMGTGVHQRLVESTRSDASPVIGLQLAQSKRVTARLLAEQGLPVPEHQRVHDADEAEAVALRLGFPVVVKPDDQDQGQGVAAGLRSAAEVRAAYAAARALSPQVLVERHVEGLGHRLTVVDGQVMGLLRRTPGGVRGDGVHDVSALLALTHEQPLVRRSRNLGRVELDPEALALLEGAGLTPQSVPAAGQFVRLRRRDNVSAGGTLEHLDPLVAHPDNLRLAQRAAEALYLDVAGVDLLSTDITRSWRDTGAVICEVNGTPQVGAGPAGNHHDRLLERLFPRGSRIPVHLLLYGDEADAGLAGRLHALAHQHALEATACRAEVRVNGELLASQLTDDFAAARVALFNRQCRSLLIAATPGSLVAAGLPVDRIDAVHLPAQHGWPDAERRCLRMALKLCAAPQLLAFDGA